MLAAPATALQSQLFAYAYSEKIADASTRDGMLEGLQLCLPDTPVSSAGNAAILEQHYEHVISATSACRAGAVLESAAAAHAWQGAHEASGPESCQTSPHAAKHAQTSEWHICRGLAWLQCCQQDACQQLGTGNLLASFPLSVLQPRETLPDGPSVSQAHAELNGTT